MTFWTYMLHCSYRTFYVGHTDDLEKRIGQHEHGLVPGYTSTRRPRESGVQLPLLGLEEKLDSRFRGNDVGCENGSSLGSSHASPGNAGSNDRDQG